MTAIFFYGLFMDDGLLRDSDFEPSEPVIAFAQDYGLRIGARATLIVSKDEPAYGTVMQLKTREIASLYSEPSVADYKETPINVTLPDGSEQQVRTYLLPEESLSGRNPNYTAKLAVVAKKMGLPQDYVSQIAK